MCLKETLKVRVWGKKPRRASEEGLSRFAFSSPVKEFGPVLPTREFWVPGRVPCEFGSKVLGDCSSLRGKGWPGGAEEWLGLGQNVKDSFLPGVPLELGFGGLPGCALGFRACWRRSSSLPDNFASRWCRVSGKAIISQKDICLGEFPCLPWRT